MSACTNNVRDFPQAKLDSEINARFLLNEHGHLYFLLHNFNENSILNNWEKNSQKSMATFLVKEINSTEGDMTGSAVHVQIMFPLEVKKCRVFEDTFSGT